MKMSPMTVSLAFALMVGCGGTGFAQTTPAQTTAPTQGTPPAATTASDPAAAATVPPPTPTPAPTIRGVRVTIQTALGSIIVALDPVHAPITTANFLRYVDARKLDGTTFYRSMRFGPGSGLIQGGLRGDPKKVGRPIAHEPTTKTGLSHLQGTISMARLAPGSATADFFITANDLKGLDADPSQPGDNAGFAAFGQVIEGMEVVQRILDAPTSPTLGQGIMKGQMLAPTIRILTVRRTTP